jgi:predicted RNA methylase
MKQNDDDNLDLNLLKDVYSKDFDPELRFQTINRFSHHLMPEWFLPMLNDTARNTYYSKMLEHSVKDKVVIDLGSGTGMWSMEALARGAKFVYIVEKNPLLIKYLEFIFQDHPVKILGKPFDQLKPSDFDQGKPEAIVHEIFSNTGLGEGVINAFQKVTELFPKHTLTLFPRYFWFEARVCKDAPFELSALEKNHLKDKADAYYELIHSLNVRDWGVLKNVDFSDIPVFNMMFLDLNKIEENKQYTLHSIPIDISPGFVHRIYLSFKFSTEVEGPFFDTLFEENHHWSGFVVEFYASKALPPGRKYLKMKLNDNQLFDEPTLEDGPG